MTGGLSKLEVRHVSVNYAGAGGRETLALSDVNLALDPGDFVVALGASGCGKTTLLSCIAGFMQPSEGEIVLDGKAVTGPGADRGVVFQKHALMPWLDVTGNVEFGLRMRGTPRQERRERARDALARMGLDRAVDRYPHELSGGMRQRVAVARALVNQPRVLLMDEPFAAVDAITRATLQQDLIELWQQTRISIVFVTHNIDEAVYLAQRVVVMKPHPGSVKTVMNIDLPYPRQRTSSDFSAAFAALGEALGE